MKNCFCMHMDHLGLRALLIKGETGIHFGRNATRNDLENFLSEFYKLRRRHIYDVIQATQDYIPNGQQQAWPVSPSRHSFAWHTE
jgi:hypothetical protein